MNLQVHANLSEEHTTSLNPENRESMFLRNFAIYLQVEMASQPRRPTASQHALLVYLSVFINYLCFKFPNSFMETLYFKVQKVTYSGSSHHCPLRVQFIKAKIITSNSLFWMRSNLPVERTFTFSRNLATVVKTEDQVSGVVTFVQVWKKL
jgi:hypothetical protein